MINGEDGLNDGGKVIFIIGDKESGILGALNAIILNCDSVEI